MKLGGKTLIIAGLLLLVMGVEAAIIYFVVPPRSATGGQTADGGSPGNGTGAVADGGKMGKEKDDEPAIKDDTEEVDLGAFNCTNSRISPGSVFHISFKLTSIVSSSQRQSFDSAATKSHKTRVKQSVERIIRSSSLEDLNDPLHSTIRRLIREEINKTLHKSYVTEVVIHDYKMLEQ